jgi:heme exporter protein A
MTQSTGSLFIGEDLDCIRGERRVFSKVSFKLEAGAALVLTGPNGSGKSSLLRLMAGLLAPAVGTLAWDGEAIAEDPEAHHRRLHYVGHLDAIKPALTVAENLRGWAELHRGRAVTPALIETALSAFAMERLADLPARFLSAGQRRRANLARLVAAPAAVWLLDEPTTALDAQATARLEAAIADHRAAGGMVVLATHAAIDLADAGNLDLGADIEVGRAASIGPTSNGLGPDGPGLGGSAL